MNAQICELEGRTQVILQEMENVEMKHQEEILKLVQENRGVKSDYETAILEKSKSDSLIQEL